MDIYPYSTLTIAQSAAKLQREKLDNVPCIIVASSLHQVHINIMPKNVVYFIGLQIFPARRYRSDGRCCEGREGVAGGMG